ncbi:MAG: helix-turn-helix domain-containing protein [Thermoanaerobaculia bacterium]|nr:helix-turn-helix domain-containing protein [Thermoanaerobaculia bacterium]
MGLSHDRLAERLGTSRFTVIKWEKGLHRPGADYLRRLRDVTGQPDLFPEEDDDEESG